MWQRQDGKCEEQRITGDPEVASKLLAVGWLPFGDEYSDALMAPSEPFFGLDEFEEFDSLGGFGGHTAWIDGDPFTEAGSPAVDSVTRTVEVREENGQRRRKEVITRCHNGECATQVIHDDEDKTPGAIAEAAAVGAPSAVAEAGASGEAPGAGVVEEASASATRRAAPMADVAGGGAPAFGRRPSTGPRRGIIEDAERAAAAAKLHAQASVEKAADDIDSVLHTVADTVSAVHAVADRAAAAAARRHAEANGERTAEKAADGVAEADPQSERATFDGVLHTVADTVSAAHAIADRVAAAAAKRHAQANGEKTDARPEAPPDDLAKTAAPQVPSAESEPAAFDSVVRTVVIKEVNGRREETETIERCRDGKCTKEVRRLSPDGEESSSTQEYSLAAP